MPFPKQEKHDFNVLRISAARPNQSGIYGIFNHTCCIYIAKADDIRESLLQHINGLTDQAICILETDPQYWLAMIVGKSQLSFWEKIFLRELQPVCLPQRSSLPSER